MPGGDRTGPAGTGPLTGRGLGFGAGYSVPGYKNRIPSERFLAGAGYGPARGSAFRGRRAGGFGLGRNRGFGLNRRGRR